MDNVNYNKEKGYLKKFLRVYLKKRPVSHALWRSAEYKEIIKLDVKKPILDLGCSDGFFASLVFGKEIDAGIDLNKKEVLMARELKIYKELYAQNAKKMPFHSNHFSTVFSNCAMEHVGPLDDVLSEISRVLKHDGLFIFTVPSNYFNEMLFFSNFFEKYGCKKYGDLYIKLINKLLVHLNIGNVDFWRLHLNKFGLKIIKSNYFLDKKCMKIFDLTTPFGAPSRLWRKLFGRWVIGPRFLWTWLIEDYFYKLLNRKVSVGGGLIIIAKKL